MPDRLGFGALEVLVGAAIGAGMALAIVTLLATGSHEASVSEDYMFAEALALRHVADVMARPWADLEAALPLDVPIRGVPAGDEALARTRAEYGRNLEGPASVAGRLTATEIRPGLVAIEASLTWAVRPGSTTRRRYAILRFHGRKDLAITSDYFFQTHSETSGSRYAQGS